VANRLRGSGEPGDGFEEGVKLQIMFFGNRKILFLLRKIKKVVFLRNRNM
jgi:hypothetical protein